MKGENLLYKNVVPSSLDAVKSQRDSYLEQRTNAMAHRYYYHAHLCRLRYDDCLLALSAEFHLAPETIINYLKQRVGLVNSLADKQTAPAVLRQRYPYFDWSVRSTPPKPATPARNVQLSVFSDDR